MKGLRAVMILNCWEGGYGWADAGGPIMEAHEITRRPFELEDKMLEEIKARAQVNKSKATAKKTTTKKKVATKETTTKTTEVEDVKEGSMSLPIVVCVMEKKLRMKCEKFADGPCPNPGS